MFTRRQFLKVGASGALLLSTARIGRAQPPRGGETATPPALDGGARAIVLAIIPVLLAGALPVERLARAKRIAATADGVATAMAALPPHAQADLGDLFFLLAFAPTRWLLAGVRSPWNEAPAGEIAGFLERWRASGWALKQQAYQALHDLVIGAFYADSASWPMIGYPGPPRID